MSRRTTHWLSGSSRRTSAGSSCTPGSTPTGRATRRPSRHWRSRIWPCASPRWSNVMPTCCGPTPASPQRRSTCWRWCPTWCAATTSTVSISTTTSTPTRWSTRTASTRRSRTTRRGPATGSRAAHLRATTGAAPMSICWSRRCTARCSRSSPGSASVSARSASASPNCGRPASAASVSTTSCMQMSRSGFTTVGSTTWCRSCTGRSTAKAKNSRRCWTTGWPTTARSATCGRACSRAWCATKRKTKRLAGGSGRRRKSSSR